MIGGVVLLAVGVVFLFYPRPLAALLSRWKQDIREPFLTPAGRVRTARGVGLIAAVVGLFAVLLAG